MLRSKTALALTSAVAIAAMGATTGVASAHTVRFDSQVTAHFTEQPGPPDISSDSGWDYFSGRVTSPRLACKANRVVRVYKRQPGDDPSQGTKTDADGFWRINSEDPPNGTYYARAARKVVANTTVHTHVCKAAQSPDVLVTGQP